MSRMIYNRCIRGEHSASKLEVNAWMLRKPERAPTSVSRS
jgi:hypothetical protein